ncbi:unnamed protein product [Allacma fusca]|uniref:Neurensin-1 n=1 Tax=Allacma fusca TaxID=39272 RepID=A0A8J2L7K7_9HEXA|nr:unnamed protein product [Allacma fusca]
MIHPKGRKCGAVWFKIGLIIGATLFLLGAVAIVIGYAIPRQETVIGRNDEYEVVDKDAVRFNRNLDICKLIGLAGFCSGGLVLVISLLAPTFTSSYWEDDPATEPFRVSLSSSLVYESEPKSPIPVTEKINCIQPIWSD